MNSRVERRTNGHERGRKNTQRQCQHCRCFHGLPKNAAMSSELQYTVNEAESALARKSERPHLRLLFALHFFHFRGERVVIGDDVVAVIHFIVVFMDELVPLRCQLLDRGVLLFDSGVSFIQTIR